MNNIVKRIYASYEANAEPPRAHLGASIIGHPCSRYLWYSFHWVDAKPFDGRTLRLFASGYAEEPRFIADLDSIGIHIMEGEHSFTGYKGHFRGTCDGLAVIDGVKHLLEFKTHNSKSFKELEKKGMQEAKPMHYVQMQVYMGCMHLTRGLYLAKNKDTDELYAEYVHFNEESFQHAYKKAMTIIDAEKAPDGIDSFECNWCAFKEVCQDGKITSRNCRTCAHSTPVEYGQWDCEKHQDKQPLSFQRIGCHLHLYNPCLIPSVAIDAGNDWVEYENGFIDGAKPS